MGKQLQNPNACQTFSLPFLAILWPLICAQLNFDGHLDQDKQYVPPFPTCYSKSARHGLHQSNNHCLLARPQKV
uniref:Secreted protein n=1 Tax=Ditylenchus dipsaci TaxID=166011 RepID=A0A915DI22_9BILA